MRTSTWVLSTAVLLGVVSSNVRAQCVLHPLAPDACGPGFYIYNPCENCGCLRGPYYCVRPQSPCFNGLQTCKEQEIRQQIAMAQYQAAMQQQQQQQYGPGPQQGIPGYGPMPQYPGFPGFAPGVGPTCAPTPQEMAWRQACGLPPLAPAAQPGGGGILAFPTHPYSRSPRDFFMMETK
jgi:hypothetical protein